MTQVVVPVQSTPPRPTPSELPTLTPSFRRKVVQGPAGQGGLTPPRPGGAALLAAVLTPPPSRAAVAARRRGSQRYLGFGVKAAGGSTRWDPGLP